MQQSFTAPSLAVVAASNGALVVIYTSYVKQRENSCILLLYKIGEALSEHQIMITRATVDTVASPP